MMNCDGSNRSKRPRTTPSPSGSGARTTQRLPLSCTECSRRKIKCDRSIPCRQCIDRGDDSGCRREQVTVKGALQNNDPARRRKTFEELQLQVEELSRRIEDLEKNTRYPAQDGINGKSRPASPLNVDTTRLPGIMEEAALGIGETTRWKAPGRRESDQAENSYQQWYSPKPLEACLAVLPSQSQARALSNMYQDNAGWITGSVHMSAFLKQQDRFWIEMESHSVRDDIWLALYFAVLSVSAFFVEDTLAATANLTVQQMHYVGRSCFEAAVATIFRLDGMTRPSTILCQAVQTLGPAFHFTSNTSLHRSLTALSTSHARSLNLHLLGQKPARDGSEQDIGRRIWWNIVEPDWTFLPYNRYCTISPRHFTSAVPANELDFPSVDLAYRSICFSTARVLYDLFGELSSNEDPSYDSVTAASKRIHDIRENILRVRQSDSQGHDQNLVQQQLIDMTMAYRDYQCHRLYFIKALTDIRYAKSYTACIEAAETIYTVCSFHLPKPYLLMWNTAVMVVAGGIILALDYMFKATSSPSNDQPDRITVVTSLVTRLRELQDPSGISTRGATLIDHLLALGHERQLGLTKDVTITREAVLELITSSKSTGNLDVLWQRPKNLQQFDSTSDPFSAVPIATNSTADAVNSLPQMWADSSNEGTFTQTDFDFDFARLLGQIMPNAG